MSKVIQVKPYLRDLKYVNGLECTIIEKYQHIGVSVTYQRSNKSFKFYDWNSSEIKLFEEAEYSKPIKDIIDKYLTSLMIVVDGIGLEYAQFVFCTSPLMLVDVIVTPNKYLSPGMIQDFFGKVVNTQKIIATSRIDLNTKFSNVVIKPNVFKTHVVNNAFLPLYVEV